MKSLKKDLTAITGTLYRNTKSPNGTEKPNSAYSFIGVFSVSLLSEMNGTHAICMSRTVPNTNITLIPMASIPISATRILSRCSKQKNLIQRNGQSFSELREQSMLFPLQSITTDFRCTGAKSHTGTLTKWGLTVTFSEN